VLRNEAQSALQSPIGLLRVGVAKATHMRTPVVCGNWKMHKDGAGTTSFFESFRTLVERPENCEIVICPSFVNLETAVRATRGTRIQVGAQNLCWATEGAFTGEVSGPMIRALGCSHVIVGHSERREYFGETNESVLKKTVAAIDSGLTPIVCVGEREKKNAGKALMEQFRYAIAALSDEQFARIVIAYEPVWAIGTGETATPATAAAAHDLIRGQAKGNFGKEAANNVRILYGGSVKPDNAKSLMAQPGIDGLLVGGASLDPVSFGAIVNLSTCQASRTSSVSYAKSSVIERG
jgi:triosephosphate isomerase (TIM)